MAFLQLQTFTFPNWQHGGTLGYARTFASQGTFESTTGLFVPQGIVSDINSCCQVVTCSIDGTNFTIPSFQLATTIDSTVANTVYTTVLYDAKNVPQYTLLSQYFVDPEFFQSPAQSSVLVATAGTIEVNGLFTYRGQSNSYPFYNLEGSPDDPTTLSIVNINAFFYITDSTGEQMYVGANSVDFPWQTAFLTVDGDTPIPTVSQDNNLVSGTWEQLILSNQGQNIIPFTFSGPFWNVPQVKEYVNSVVGTGTTPFASKLITGKTALSADPSLASNPIAIGANDPTWLALNDRLYVRNYASFAAAVTAIGSTPCELVVTQALTAITTNITLPATLQLTFEGVGSITVSTGHTLTIANLTPPSEKQIFFGAGNIVFARNAVSAFNLSWWAGISSAADQNHAFAQAITSLTNNLGGVLLIPSGVWLVNNQTIPSSSIIRGVGTNTNGTQASVLKIVTGTNNTTVLNFTGAFRDIVVENLVLDCGTSTGSKCFVASGAAGASAFGLTFRNVTFNGGTLGHSFHTTSGNWELENVVFYDCNWIGQTVAAGDCDSVNIDLMFITPFCEQSNGVHGLQFTAVGEVTVINRLLTATTPNPVCTLGVPNNLGRALNFIGTHGTVQIIGGVDEGFGYSLMLDSANPGGVSNTINLISTEMQGFVRLNQACNINVVGGDYCGKAFQAAVGVSARVTSSGIVNVRSTDPCGASVSPVVLCDFAGTQSNHVVIPGRDVQTIQTSTNVFTPSIYDGSPSTAVLSAGYNSGITEEKRLFEMGLKNSSGVFTQSYYYIRSQTTGRRQVFGTQTGFIGYDYDGDISALNFVGGELSPAQITSSQNDYNPGTNQQNLRLSTDASRNITGLTMLSPAKTGGSFRVIENIGSQNIVLVNQSASSAAANRFANVTGADITLTPNNLAFLLYDSVTARWRVYSTSPTGIAATSIADGSVSNAEFQFINSVTSNVQTQLDAKVNATSVLRKRVATNVTNATAVMANVTDLSVTLIAGHSYVGQMVVKCSNSTAAEGIAIDFDGGTSTMSSFAAALGVTAGGTSVLTVITSSALATDLVATTITNETWLMIPISLVVNAGGTLIPRFCEGTAHTSGTATFSAGSYLELTDIT